jgi:hypothetical protein
MALFSVSRELDHKALQSRLVERGADPTGDGVVDDDGAERAIESSKHITASAA